MGVVDVSVYPVVEGLVVVENVQVDQGLAEASGLVGNPVRFAGAVPEVWEANALACTSSYLTIQNGEAVRCRVGGGSTAVGQPPCTD